MSEPINQMRRRILQLGFCSGITLFVNKLYADDITNLVESGSTKTTINQMIAIRLWPSKVYTRITLEAQSTIQAKYFTLESPKRLAIDIENTQLSNLFKNLTEQIINEDPVVANIKVGQFNPTTVRIVIYLKDDVKMSSQLLSPIHVADVNYKYRFILDIYKKNVTANTPDELNDDLLAMLQLDSESTNTKISRESYPSFKSIQNSKQKNKGKILIMLDPGHGGEDPGAIGPSRLKEKHVVLEIAKNLYDLINQTDYMRAEMTRTQDIFIPLGTRVAIARKFGADLFVSIHADAFTSPDPSGSSVFMLSDKGASSSFAKWLAISQNASDQIGGASFQTKNSIVRKVLLDMSQTWTRRQSSQFGSIMLQNLAKVHNLHNKNIEQANFAVLKAPDIPSILVETAFISNLHDESLLQTVAFKQEIATAIFNGVSGYSKTLLTG